MLDAVDLINLPVPNERFFTFNALLKHDDDHYFNHHGTIDAVILGGETGPGARPMHPDWVRSVRDQCAAAGVPFFFKQWGEWAHESQYSFGPDPFTEQSIRNAMYHIWPGGNRSYRVGRTKTGRLLDGWTHDDLPWVKIWQTLKT
jgi:protein gp37